MKASSSITVSGLISVLKPSHEIGSEVNCKVFKCCHSVRSDFCSKTFTWNWVQSQLLSLNVLSGLISAVNHLHEFGSEVNCYLHMLSGLISAVKLSHEIGCEAICHVPSALISVVKPSHEIGSEVNCKVFTCCHSVRSDFWSKTCTWNCVWSQLLSPSCAVRSDFCSKTCMWNWVWSQL